MAKWDVHFTRPANLDIVEVLAHSQQTFGLEQTSRYGELLDDAIVHLETDPLAYPAKKLPDKDIYALHLSRPGRRAGHRLLYRVLLATKRVEILRLLHDAMDPARHLP